MHWTGPNQNWNYMCAECHSTDLHKRYSVDQDRYQTTWAEMDVSCEACHGPASRHLAWAKATAQGDQNEDSVLQGLEVSFRGQPDIGWAFDPGATTARRSHTRSSRTEIETCARCHSRRSVLKQDYQHGRLLMDSHRPALLRTPLYHPDGQIQEEVYVYGSFLQSKMYQAGVTCTDCHDPHSLQLDSPGNNLCTRCHQAQSYESRDHHFHEPGTPAATCLECHMPAQTYMVIDPRRDHSLRVPRPDLSLTLGTPNACNDCHTDRPAKWAAEQVKEWYGSDRETHYGEALYAGEHGLAGAGETLAELVQDSDQPAIVRASALSLLSGYPGGLPTSSLQRLLQEIDPLLRHSALLVVENLEPRFRLDLAFPLLSDPILTVRIEAARVLAGVSTELMTTSQQHRHREVLEEYKKTQMATAERPESHMNLGNLHLQLGEWSLAEQEYQTALRIDSAFIPAYVNLADQYRVQGREQEAEEILLRGQKSSDHADLHHAIGLLLVRQQRLPEAIISLEKAARQEPGVARYSYVYGVALQSAGREREALNVLRSAQKRHPNDREILWALVTYLVQSGSPQEALGYAEKLRELFPQDPQIQNLIRNLDPGR